jgi:hypothetical protein
MALILPMLLGPFRPPKPENRICCGTHLMVTGRTREFSRSLYLSGFVPTYGLRIAYLSAYGGRARAEFPYSDWPILSADLWSPAILIALVPR